MYKDLLQYLIVMNNTEQMDSSLMDVDEIKKLRQQLTQFIPAEGNLEVIFHLPNGESVQVPISKKSKIELLSKEVRNHLAEEQLIRQGKINLC